MQGPVDCRVFGRRERRKGRKDPVEVVNRRTSRKVENEFGRRIYIAFLLEYS